MAWNGSGGKLDAKAAASKSAAKMPSLLRGGVAGVLVIALTAAVYLLFFAKADKQAPKPVPRNQPAKVVKAKPAPAAPPRKTESKVPEELPPQRIGELRNGYRLLPSGRLHRVKGTVECGGRGNSLVDRTFECGSDRMIAHLLIAEPGGTMVGDSESIMHGFSEAFEKSLSERIVVSNDDPDDVRELKQAVIDARKELQSQIAAGRSAEEVMVEARNQLLELSLYHEELKREVLRLSQDGLSQKDYDELIGAANLMLEERGIGNIQMPKFVGDAIEMRYRRELAELERKQHELEKELKEEERK